MFCVETVKISMPLLFFLFSDFYWLIFPKLLLLLVSHLLILLLIPFVLPLCSASIGTLSMSCIVVWAQNWSRNLWFILESSSRDLEFFLHIFSSLEWKGSFSLRLSQEARWESRSGRGNSEGVISSPCSAHKTHTHTHNMRDLLHVWQTVSPAGCW